MKFGIFYELQLPKPWGPDDEYTLLANALDQIELADQLGYDYAWEVEHHFLEEYSHSSAPEVFLAAVSQRTRNIRLGHGIVQLPNEINPTARVAEANAFGALAGGSQQHLGRRAVAVLLEEVVLDGPDAVEAESIGKFDLIERVLVQLVLVIGPPWSGQL